MDESTFKQVQASKKARVRAKKKITNEIAFKKGIAKEKASQRSKKKNMDEKGGEGSGSQSSNQNILPPRVSNRDPQIISASMFLIFEWMLSEMCLCP